VDAKRLRGASCKVFQYTKDGEAKPVFLMLDSISFDSVVTASSLNKRGWVTQERLLSRRVVHFTVHGIMLECSDTILHEQHSSVRVRQYQRTLEVIRGPLFERDFDESCWSDFIALYSKTEFTDPTDRLIALSSLARLHHQQRSRDDHYCAGMWKNCLVRSITWHRTDPPTPATSDRLGIAPSWSWASIVGGVQYPEFIGNGNLEKVKILDILDFHSVPAQRNNPYGNVEQGSIRVLARLLSLTLPADFRLNFAGQPYMRGWSPVIRSVFWDETKHESKKPREFLVIPCETIITAFRGSKLISHAALIVEPASILKGTNEGKKGMNTYRRIGLVLDKFVAQKKNEIEAWGKGYNWGCPLKEREIVVLV